MLARDAGSSGSTPDLLNEKPLGWPRYLGFNEPSNAVVQTHPCHPRPSVISHCSPITPFDILYPSLPPPLKSPLSGLASLGSVCSDFAPTCPPALLLLSEEGSKPHCVRGTFKHL